MLGLTLRVLCRGRLPELIHAVLALVRGATGDLLRRSYGLVGHRRVGCPRSGKGRSRKLQGQRLAKYLFSVLGMALVHSEFRRSDCRCLLWSNWQAALGGVGRMSRLLHQLRLAGLGHAIYVPLSLGCHGSPRFGHHVAGRTGRWRMGDLLDLAFAIVHYNWSSGATMRGEGGGQLCTQRRRGRRTSLAPG